MKQTECIPQNRNHAAASTGRLDELTEYSPEEHTTDAGERIAAEPEWSE
jgi:hypothetical protein